MKRRILFGLTAATLAVALVGCASMRRNQLADELRTALAGEPVNIVVANDIITMSSSADYLYPSGGWQLRPDAPILSKMAPVLATLQNTNIIVAGYTDDTPIGPQLKRMGVTTNTDLSFRRAQAVVDFLAAHGVKQSLMSAQAYGEANPVAPNDTPEGKAKNRRVVISLSGNGS